jgi:hypothetical protein
VTIRLRVFTRQLVATATTYVRFDVVHFFDLLNRHRFASGALMAFLGAAFAPALGSPTPFPRHLRPITGWGPGGIA